MPSNSRASAFDRPIDLKKKLRKIINARQGSYKETVTIMCNCVRRFPAYVET